MKTYRITDKRNQAFYPVLVCLVIVLYLFIQTLFSENSSPVQVGVGIFSLAELVVFAGIAFPSFLLTRYRVLIKPEGIQWILFNRPRYSLSWDDCERIEYYEKRFSSSGNIEERYIFFSDNKHKIAPFYFSHPAKLCRLPFPGEKGAFVQFSEEADTLITQFASRKSLKSYSKPYGPEEDDNLDHLFTLSEERKNTSKARKISLGICCMISLTVLVYSLLSKEKAGMIIAETICALYFGISFFKSVFGHKKTDARTR